MRLSANSHKQLEEFFREHFADENLELPVIEIYGRRGSRYLTKILAVEGICFGRHIFIAPHRLSRDETGRLRASRELVAHELAHTLQYRREGIFRFLFNYVSAYLAALRQKEKRGALARLEAYREIPHEVEARSVAAKYVDWCECRKSV